MFKTLLNNAENMIDIRGFQMAVIGVQCMQDYGLVELLNECDGNKDLFYNLLTRYFFLKAELKSLGFVFSS